MLNIDKQKFKILKIGIDYKEAKRNKDTIKEFILKRKLNEAIDEYKQRL